MTSPFSENEYLYGLNPVFEAIRSGRRKFIRAYINQSLSSNKRIEKFVKLCKQNNIPVESVEKGKLIQLCNSRDNQGAVLHCSHYPYIRFEETLSSDKLLLIDNVEDPHNVGAILRSAEIFGFKNVLLPRKGVPDVYPSVVKVSAGAAEFMNIVKEHFANSYAKRAKEEGYSIVVLDAKGDVAINDLPDAATKKILLVIGGEDKSVGQFIINMADYIVKINQFGKINSLNSSVAAGVAMYALSER